MFSTFFKWQLFGMTARFGSGEKKNIFSKAASAIGGFGVFILLFAVIFAFIFWLMGFIFPVTNELGFTWLAFAFLAVTIFLIDSFLGMQTIATRIFDAKDNELLLSMPIPTSVILLGRVVPLYLRSLYITVAFMLPAFIQCAMVAGTTIPQIIGWLLVLAFTPCASLTVRLLLGWVLGAIIARSRNKNIVTFVGTSIFMILYFAFVGVGMQGLADQLVTNAESFLQVFRTWLFYFGWIGFGCAGDLAQSALAAGFAAVVFAAMYLVLALSYVRIITTNRGARKTKAQPNAQIHVKKESATSAIIRKEVRTIIGNPNVILNYVFGPIMLIFFIVALLLVPDASIEVLKNFSMGEGMPPLLTNVMSIIVCLILVMCSICSCITCVGISLEGKSFWILKSSPVDAWTVLNAKVIFHLLINIPLMVICGVLALIHLSTGDIIGDVCSILIPVFLTFIIGYTCLYTNIKHPVLYWNRLNELSKSTSSLTSIGIGFGFLILIVALYVLGGDSLGAGVYLLIWAIVSGVLAVAAFWVLRTKGVAAYESIDL